MMANLRGLFLLVLLATASAKLALLIRDDLQRQPETLAAVMPDADWALKAAPPVLSATRQFSRITMDLLDNRMAEPRLH